MYPSTFLTAERDDHRPDDGWKTTNKQRRCKSEHQNYNVLFLYTSPECKKWNWEVLLQSVEHWLDDWWGDIKVGWILLKFDCIFDIYVTFKLTKQQFVRSRLCTRDAPTGSTLHPLLGRLCIFRGRGPAVSKTTFYWRDCAPPRLFNPATSSLVDIICCHNEAPHTR